MHEIYRSANQIFVDLGRPPEGIELAVEVLTNAARASDSSKQVQDHSESAQSGLYHNHLPPTTEISVDQAVALSRFAGLPYWKRTWCAQEVCLWDVFTAYPPIFLCGNHKVQWIDLISAAAEMERAPARIKYGPEGVPPELKGASVGVKSWSAPVIGIYMEHYKMISKQGPVRDLHWFLQRAWSLSSTDPADKVYGLLGFVNDQYSIVHSGTASRYMRKNGLAQKLEGKQEIRVDYDLPFRMVYEDICRLTLQEQNSLDPLADAGSGKSTRNPQLPSWVPDWNNYPEEFALLSRFGPATVPQYRASLGTKPHLKRGQLPGLLEIEAYLVDVVHMEAARCCGEEDIIEIFGDASLQQLPLISLKEHIMSLWWCFGVKWNRYPTGERPFDVFWRTLIANRFTVGNQKVMLPARFAESFLMACPEILEVETTDVKPACVCPKWAIVKSQQILQAGLSHDLSETDDKSDKEKPLPIGDKYPCPGELFGNDLPLYSEHYNMALYQAARGRRFFKTKNGYMGIGPRNLSRFDHVAILKGGSLPFLLRKADVGDVEGKPVYTLLGEAYVHGLSDGEALQDFENPQNDSRWTRVVLK